MGKHISICAAFSMVFLGCVAPAEVEENAWTNQARAEEKKMALVPVGPAPGGPFATILCPDDGNTATAEDLRRLASILLKNDQLIGVPVEYTFIDPDAHISPFVVGPPNTFSGNTWTDSAILIDVPNSKVGDKIEVHAFGNWQFNSSSSPGNVVGRARIGIVEDVDAANGGPFAYPVANYGVATIYDDGGNLTLPHNEPWDLHFKYTVIQPGKTRFTVQVRSEDLTGGAGTATIVLMFSARMDITHWKKP